MAGIAMSDHFKGCGKDDKSLTLYRIPSHGELSPLSGGYYHLRCGYRPPSKMKNGILLCDACVAKLGLPAVCDPLRDTLPVRADSHEGNGPRFASRILEVLSLAERLWQDWVFKS